MPNLVHLDVSSSCRAVMVIHNKLWNILHQKCWILIVIQLQKVCFVSPRQMLQPWLAPWSWEGLTSCCCWVSGSLQKVCVDYNWCGLLYETSSFGGFVFVSDISVCQCVCVWVCAGERRKLVERASWLCHRSLSVMKCMKGVEGRRVKPLGCRKVTLIRWKLRESLEVNRWRGAVRNVWSKVRENCRMFSLIQRCKHCTHSKYNAVLKLDPRFFFAIVWFFKTNTHTHTKKSSSGRIRNSEH